KLSWFTAEHRAEVTAASGRAIPALMGVPAHQLQTLILAPLVPLLLVGVIGAVLGAAPALFVAGVLVVALAAQIASQRWLSGVDTARHRAESASTAATLELVEHRELLRATAGPSRSLDRAELAWAEQERAMARTNRAAAPATLVSGLASALPLAGALVFLLVSGGFAEPAAALALLVLTIRAGAPLDDVALSGIAVTEVRAHLGAYRAVAAAPALPQPAVAGPEPLGNGFDIESLRRAPALDGLSARIPPGSRVLITGPSGSGKSTLLGLLLRFDDPDAGRITLGGVPLPELSEEQLTSRFAFVPQDPVVFSGTLAENLRIGRPDAAEDELRHAARLAQLGALLERDPRGIHQPVGPHGQALSGGERQRVAIARAILKRAPVLVLDEATSALDADTERRIAAALRELDATMIVVTHRDAGLWHPDRTIELRGGSAA
ncbi:ATP-binding cassette domain-containing protein, partial [Leucobacter sp. M11]|uniref:ATP-binding cassette domain-containing protein n=1 Tax=Leucobacter sp. M11 TaxID=2993565 RepID=UPI002D7FC66B